MSLADRIAGMLKYRSASCIAVLQFRSLEKNIKIRVKFQVLSFMWAKKDSECTMNKIDEAELEALKSSITWNMQGLD